MYCVYCTKLLLSKLHFNSSTKHIHTNIIINFYAYFHSIKIKII